MTFIYISFIICLTCIQKTVNKHAIIAFLFTEQATMSISSYPSIISITFGLDFSLFDRERSKYLTPQPDAKGYNSADNFRTYSICSERTADKITDNRTGGC